MTGIRKFPRIYPPIVWIIAGPALPQVILDIAPKPVTNQEPLEFVAAVWAGHNAMPMS